MRVLRRSDMCINTFKCNFKTNSQVKRRSNEVCDSLHNRNGDEDLLGLATVDTGCIPICVEKILCCGYFVKQIARKGINVQHGCASAFIF